MLHNLLVAAFEKGSFSFDMIASATMFDEVNYQVRNNRGLGDSNIFRIEYSDNKTEFYCTPVVETDEQVKKKISEICGYDVSTKLIKATTVFAQGVPVVLQVLG